MQFSSLIHESEPIVIEVYDRGEGGDFLGEVVLPLTVIRVRRLFYFIFIF